MTFTNKFFLLTMEEVNMNMLFQALLRLSLLYIVKKIELNLLIFARWQEIKINFSLLTS